MIKKNPAMGGGASAVSHRHFENTGSPAVAQACQRSTPQVVVEAIMWTVRERGLQALQEAANLERLGRCDATARQQINDRIARLFKEAT